MPQKESLCFSFFLLIFIAEGVCFFFPLSLQRANNIINAQLQLQSTVIKKRECVEKRGEGKGVRVLRDWAAIEEQSGQVRLRRIVGGFSPNGGGGVGASRARNR